MPDGNVSSTTFKQNVYCDNSTISGGFYLSDVVDADTSNSFTVTYMNGDRLVTKLVVGLGQKAISVSLPTDGKLYVWCNGDVVYNFDEQVNDDLVLTAKWYVTAEVADSLTDELDNARSELDKTKVELDETRNEVAQAQSKLDSLNGNLNNATEDINELNDKLRSVTAWMIVWIALFGLSCGTGVTLLIIFKRKKEG